MSSVKGPAGTGAVEKRSGAGGMTRRRAHSRDGRIDRLVAAALEELREQGPAHHQVEDARLLLPRR